MVVMVQSVILSLSLPPTKTVIFYYYLFPFSSSQLINTFIMFYFLDFTSLQLLLSCGQEVTIYSKPVGYSNNGPPASGLPVRNGFSVNSWTNDLEDDFFEAQVYF